MSNVFILKSKGPSIDPWGTPFYIFDHVLKDVEQFGRWYKHLDAPLD